MPTVLFVYLEVANVFTSFKIVMSGRKDANHTVLSKVNYMYKKTLGSMMNNYSVYIDCFECNNIMLYVYKQHATAIFEINLSVNEQ